MTTNKTPEKTAHLFRTTHLKCIALLAVASIQLNAQAQRGLPAPDNETDNKSPSRRIPGFFDTNTAEPKNLVGDLPTFAVDFGLTENLTVGTNALAVLSTLAWASNRGSGNLPPVMFKSRYKALDTMGWTAAFTGYISAVSLNAKQQLSSSTQKQLILFSAASINSAYEYSLGSVGISLFAGRLSATSGSPSDKTYSKFQRTTQLPAIWWRHTLAESFEHELLLTTCLSLKGVDLNNSIRVDTTEACFGDKFTDPALRALFNWRSSKSWLWTLGGLWIQGWDWSLIPVAGITYVTDLNPDSRD